MKFNLDYEESNSRKKISGPYSIYDWETERIKKKAEKAAEEIIMNAKSDYEESNSRKKISEPYSIYDWETERIRKKAEKAAEEIIRESRIREVLREILKSARTEKRD